MPHSHHSHSGQFCKHAEGRLEEVVLEAIRQKFTVYGLTEHMPRYRKQDLYPEEADLSVEFLKQQFEAFLDEAHRLKAAYANQITLLVGMETENIAADDVHAIQQLLNEQGRRIEYLVGSLHHVNEIPIDFDLPTFQKALSTFTAPAVDPDGLLAQMDAFLCAYYDAQFELLAQVHPEIIGHFDLCRLYNPNLLLAKHPESWKKLNRNIMFAIEYGALFEINAAAFRKGWLTAYPGTEVLQLILQHGGCIALSDDSHGPQGVGLNYGRLHTYLKNSGAQELYFLQRSNAPNKFGRYVEVVKYHEEWSKSQFWSSKLALP